MIRFIFGLTDLYSKWRERRWREKINAISEHEDAQRLVDIVDKMDGEYLSYANQVAGHFINQKLLNHLNVTSYLHKGSTIDKLEKEIERQDNNATASLYIEYVLALLLTDYVGQTSFQVHRNKLKD